MQAHSEGSMTPLVARSRVGEPQPAVRLAQYNIAAVGIAAGLPFGPFGVAVGYSAATGPLIPVEWHPATTALHDAAQASRIVNTGRPPRDLGRRRRT